ARVRQPLSGPPRELLCVENTYIDNREIRLVLRKIIRQSVTLFLTKFRVRLVRDLCLVDIVRRQDDRLLLLAELERPGGYQHHLAGRRAEGLGERRPELFLRLPPQDEEHPGSNQEQQHGRGRYHPGGPARRFRHQRLRRGGRRLQTRQNAL